MKKLFLSVLFVIIFLYVSARENSAITRKILGTFMNESPKTLFKVWHFLYEKTYTFDSQEARNRFAIFKQKLKKINEHNAKNLSYKLGLNQFSDMDISEFKEKMCTKEVLNGDAFDKLVSELNPSSVKFLQDDDDDLTKRNLAYDPINYSSFFGEARDQGNCGGCWAFSVTGAIEGIIGKNQNQAGNYLSPQQLIDCDLSNRGCNGGITGNAFNYVIKKGVELDSNYSYAAKRQICNYDQALATNRISGFKFCSNYSTREETKCSVDKVYNLLQLGPLSIGIDAGTDDFSSYQSGILDTQCSQDNHAVILVGYGIENGTEFWIVRNSWSSGWGENGYVRVARNDSNRNSCFVANEAWLPII